MRRLAVTSFLTLALAIANPPSLQSATSSGDTTSSIAAIAHADHRIAIGEVGAGHEGISVSAQLGIDSTQSLKDVKWSIRRAGGDMVFDGVGAEVTALVEPGEYLVNANYGPAAYEEAFNVEPGHHLSVNLILNIGAVRILPTVAGVDDAAVKAVSKVYALTGLDRGKLVAQSSLPGEVLELVAGDYRVESRFTEGNAIAVSDVTVKPGMMSAIEFHHNAGVARLVSAANVTGAVSWTVSGGNGEAISLSGSGTHDLVMQPGHYLASATFNGSDFNTEFDLAAGETQTITLGF